MTNNKRKMTVKGWAVIGKRGSIIPQSDKEYALPIFRSETACKKYIYEWVATEHEAKPIKCEITYTLPTNKKKV